MENISIENSFEVKTICDSFLYSCITPAFIWAVQEGRLISANPMGVEFLNSFRSSVDTAELSDLIRNWKEIPDEDHHTMWFEFRSQDGRIKPVQVRNSYLTPEKTILASVVINPRWNVETTGSQSMDALLHIIGNASVTFCSRTDFLEGFESFMDITSVELGLSEFGFIPEPIFEQYDLYDRLQKNIMSKSIYPFIEENLSRFSSFEGDRLSDVSDGFAGSPIHFKIFPVSNSEQRIGYFILRFQDSALYRLDFYQTVLEILSIYFQGLFENMEMTKSLYQCEFQNSLNHQIIDNISEGIIITNNEYQIVYINQISSIMFGFAPSDVVGHPLDDLLVTNEGVRKIVQTLSSSENNSDETPFIQYLHRRSGESFPCHLRISTLDFDEKNSYTIFVLTDVSESEESRLKTEQLTQRAFLGDFASLLAHEIRNPINNMNIWIQNIKSLTDEQSDIYQAVNRIEEDCSRVSVLVNNILAFSKPLKLNLEEIDLEQYINEIIERWKLNFARANIKTFFSAPENLPKVLIDPRSMEQVFNNLIGNAIDAFDNKGGVISFKISLHDSKTGRKQVQISVSDNGPGIPDEIIDHIFEPFVTSKKKGNGWGLAVSKRIITSHKGTIQVKSYPGGTVFEITLPISTGV